MYTNICIHIYIYIYTYVYIYIYVYMCIHVCTYIQSAQYGGVVAPNHPATSVMKVSTEIAAPSKSIKSDGFLGTWWLRLVSSLKLQVSLAEHSLFYRALLQKRPTILRSLLLEATPYHSPGEIRWIPRYWVASSSRLLKIIGLFCKRAL